MVTNSLMKIVSPCWKASAVDENYGGDAGGRSNGLLWYKDLGNHACGEFSMAMVQANALLEDQSQLETGPMSLLDSGPQGTFVGVYDGHGGPEASRFVNDRLFENLRKYTSENQGMSADVIKKAFLATEEEFLSLIKKQWLTKPQVASVGSCCLVGVVCGGQLYISNSIDRRDFRKGEGRCRRSSSNRRPIWRRSRWSWRTRRSASRTRTRARTSRSTSRPSSSPSSLSPTIPRSPLRRKTKKIRRKRRS